jgi:hypothetical protein
MSKIWKPNPDEILELYAQTDKVYEDSGIRDEWDLDEKFYECDIEEFLGIPKEFKAEATALPTPRDFIDTAVDHTNVFNPVVKVPSTLTGNPRRSEADANLLEHFALGVLYRNNVEQSIAPLRVSCKHLYVNGLGILKDIYNADRYVDKPERNLDESEGVYGDRIDEWRANHHDMMPIIIQAIHPYNVMLDQFENGGLYVFETKDTLVYNVKEKYPRWSNPLGKGLTKTVTQKSFWTKDYRCEFYDDEPVLRTPVTKHTYGFIPYVPIDSGLGNISRDNNLKKRYVGLLRYCRGLIVSESRNYSNGDIVMKRGAFPMFTIDVPEGTVLPGKINLHYGERVDLPEGAKMNVLSSMVPPQELLQWMGITSTLLDSRAPRALRGLPEQGVRSGAHQNSLANQASAMYRYSNEAYKNGVSKLLSNCARIMKNVVPGDINVWAKTPVDEFDIEITKDTLKEPFTFYVDFNTMSDDEDYQKHVDLVQTVKGLSLPPSWAWGQMDNVDQKAMEKKVLKDQLVAGLLPTALQVLSAELAGALAQAGMTLPMPQPGKPNVVQGDGMIPPDEGREGMGRNIIPGVPNRAQPGSPEALNNQIRSMSSPMSASQGMGGGGNRT